MDEFKRAQGYEISNPTEPIDHANMSDTVTEIDQTVDLPIERDCSKPVEYTELDSEISYNLCDEMVYPPCTPLDFTIH